MLRRCRTSTATSLLRHLSPVPPPWILFSRGGRGTESSSSPGPTTAWEPGTRGVCDTGQVQEPRTHLPQQHPRFLLWNSTSCSAGNCSGAFSAAGCPAKTNKHHESPRWSGTRPSSQGAAARVQGCRAGDAPRDRGAHPLAISVPLHQHLLQRPQHLDAQLLLRLHQVLGVLHQPGTAQPPSHSPEGRGGPRGNRPHHPSGLQAHTGMHSPQRRCSPALPSSPSTP